MKFAPDARFNRAILLTARQATRRFDQSRSIMTTVATTSMNPRYAGKHSGHFGANATDGMASSHPDLFAQ